MKLLNCGLSERERALSQTLTETNLKLLANANKSNCNYKEVQNKLDQQLVSHRQQLKLRDN
jgi:hypothetical protein